MKGKPSHSYYPVFLNINKRKCVVVGGGPVALRKVQALLEHGADVEVISPALCPGLDQLSEEGAVSVLGRRYQRGDLSGAFLAIVATSDRSLNREVVGEAREDGILTNVVDGAGDSDFIVPSSLQRGNITIAISTAGSSPALARKIRTRLEKDLGDEYASLASLVEEVRSELKRQGSRVSGDDWQQALDLDSLIDLLKRGEREKARQVLLHNLKQE